jgi:hypothetical protein
MAFSLASRHVILLRNKCSPYQNIHRLWSYTDLVKESLPFSFSKQRKLRRGTRTFRAQRRNSRNDKVKAGDLSIKIRNWNISRGSEHFSEKFGEIPRSCVNWAWTRQCDLVGAACSTRRVQQKLRTNHLTEELKNLNTALVGRGWGAERSGGRDFARYQRGATLPARSLLLRYKCMITGRPVDTVRWWGEQHEVHPDTGPPRGGPVPPDPCQARAWRSTRWVTTNVIQYRFRKGGGISSHILSLTRRSRNFTKHQLHHVIRHPICFNNNITMIKTGTLMYLGIVMFPLNTFYCKQNWIELNWIRLVHFWTFSKNNVSFEDSFLAREIV